MNDPLLYEPFDTDGIAHDMRQDNGGSWVHIDDYTLLAEELTKYRIWFSENAANLANHRIGGFEFVDFPDVPKEQGSITTVTNIDASGVDPDRINVP